MNRQVAQAANIKKIMEQRIPVPEGKHSKSAVMVLLFPDKQDLNVLFCQRALQLKSQPGDICFPGGRQENMETPLQTALRETEEEIGLFAHDITILGQPDFVLTPFGKLIVPFLGIVENLSYDKLILNKNEVEKTFLVPLSFFLETEPIKSHISFTPKMADDFPYDFIIGGKDYNWGTTKYEEYFYEYDGNVIWGLTARIIINIKKIIRNERL